MNDVKVVPGYDPAITVRKALGELTLTAGAVALAAFAGFAGEWLASGAAATLLPPKYLIAAPFLAALGRALLNWSKNRARDEARK
jgi:hypothetical protein